MIFVGSLDKGYFAEEVSNKFNLSFDNVQEAAHISEQVNEILSYQKQDYTIFDVEQYLDDAEDVVDGIIKICNANNSKPIIFAAGYMNNSNIIVSAANKGITYFVTAVMLSDMKDQLEKCLNGYYDANGISEVEELQKIAAEEQEAREAASGDSKTIAIAGACRRIGTTTMAVQVIRYIQMQGKTACYIQMNDSSYINDMKDWYTVTEDKELGLVTFQGVDHYYDLNKIRNVIEKHYDYYVYDYGTYFDGNFNKVSFLERDIQIFVVGSEPGEMTDTRKILESSFYNTSNYVFNFTSEADRKDLKEMMEEKAEQTYFIENIPDKYVYVPNECYEKMIHIVPVQEETAVPKKKGLFRRKK